MDENATPTQQPVEVATGGVSKDARTWGMACHLMALAGLIIPGIGFILGPLVMWLIKKDEDPFIDDQGQEAVNFQITIFLALVVASLLCFIVIGFFIVPIIAIGNIVLVIIGSMKANEGVKYRYPFAIRFLK